MNYIDVSSYYFPIWMALLDKIYLSTEGSGTASINLNLVNLIFEIKPFLENTIRSWISTEGSFVRDFLIFFFHCSSFTIGKKGLILIGIRRENTTHHTHFNHTSIKNSYVIVSELEADKDSGVRKRADSAGSIYN